jgi:hypothetical protein
MLLATMLTINVSVAGTPAKLSIEPGIIPTHPSDYGHPGDTFDMSVEIDNADNVWAIGFIVDYAPYGRPLTSSFVFEGDFMDQDGYNTAFTYKINVFKGELKIGITRLVTPSKPIEGASGSGVLCTFRFTVVEAGDSDIDLTDVEVLEAVPVDPWTFTLEPLPYNAYGGYYQGVTGDLINVQIEGGKTHYVGEDLVILSQGRNDGNPTDITARTRFDIERMEDGRRIRMYSGQNYAGGGLGEPNPFEEFYLESYIGGYESGGWSHTTPVVGDSMLGAPDGDYAEGHIAYATTGYYTFPTLVLAGREMLNWDVYGYTEQPDDTSWDLDPYLDFYDQYGNFIGWAWCDSFGGASTWAWTGGRYYQGGPYDMPEYYMSAFGVPHSEEVFNNMVFGLDNYCYNDVDRQRCDSVKIFVEYSPITPVTVPTTTIPSKDEAVMLPATWNAMSSDMAGTYVLTATFEYTIEGAYWIEGAKTRTKTFVVLP